MSEIELEIGKLDIFTKFSKETILLGGLAVCRERINRIIDSNSYGKELIDEIETIDIVTQLASEYAVGSEKIDLNKIEDLNLFDDLYAKAKNYLVIHNIYEIGKEGVCKYNIEGKNIAVIFQSDSFHINTRIDIQNIITNIKNSDIKSKRMESMLGKEEKNIYEYARKIINCTQEIFLDNEMIINGFSLGDFWKIEAVLLGVCLGDYEKYKRYTILGKEEKELIDFIIKETNLQKVIVTSVLDYLTFSFQDALSLMYTPLIKFGEIVYIGTFFFINANFERNLMATMNVKSKNIIDSNQKIKEKNLLKKMQEIVKRYPNLSYIKNKKLKNDNGNIVTDIDFLVYDEKNAIVIETKNLLQPCTVSEHLNYIGRTEKKGLRKGFNQLQNIKELLEQDREKYVEEVLKNKNINTILYLLVTNGYIGNIDNSEISIMNILMFEEMIDECHGDLFQVFEYILNKKFMATINFIEGERIVELFEYTFCIPTYLIPNGELDNL